MTERIVDVDGAELAVQTFGDPAHPAILLIAGSGSSMEGWPAEFCERLAAGSRFVVRYDHRDTGRSVHYPPGEPGYTSADLVTDAAGVVDAVCGGSPHVVGISMGGALAQLLAIDHPGRVASLTLLATSPVGPSEKDLPGMSGDLRAAFAEPDPVDWSDRASVIDYYVRYQRVLAAGSRPFDERAARDMGARIADRARNIASVTNHDILTGGQRWRPRLAEIAAPTLVLHGTEDPLFPYGHAEALAREIPGTRLVPLEATGHELPGRVWDVVVPAILRHTSGGWEDQADRLAAGAIADGEPTAWFERLYPQAAGGSVDMPWDRVEPNRLLASWARDRVPAGGRALVVGCGLGADAEFVASLGFDTTAFDVAETAVELARSRHPRSTVDYQVADLLRPPEDWFGSFDLVVESHTVQALPEPPRVSRALTVTRPPRSAACPRHAGAPAARQARRR